MTIRIRPEQLADHAAIGRLTQAAFLSEPHSSQTEAFIIEALRQAGALSVSLVAEDQGELVGHIAFSPVSISDGSPGWFGLGPVAVMPARQGQGIGGQLITAGLELLREQNAAGCVLLGEPAFYGRFGFQARPELWLADVPPEYFQQLLLAGPAARGEVRYHPGFAATGQP